MRAVEELMQVIEREPGITTHAAAKKARMTTNYASHLVHLLRREGKLRPVDEERSGRLWPVGVDSPTGSRR